MRHFGIGNRANENFQIFSNLSTLWLATAVAFCFVSPATVASRQQSICARVALRGRSSEFKRQKGLAFPPGPPGFNAARCQVLRMAGGQVAPT